MYGQIEPIHLCIIVIAFTAAITDSIYKKIYNWLTLPAIVLGPIVSFYLLGPSGGLASICAIALGLALYGWMFWLGAMGGGDIKLLMAFGAWGGIGFVLDVALLSVLVGGFLAVLLLLFKGRLVQFYRKISHFFLTLMTKELEVELPKVDHKLKMPFGIPMAIAAIWIVVDNPFVKFGVRPWN